MKQLAKTYARNGYCFRLVQRVGDVAIYAQHDIDTDEIHCYEVFVVQKHDGYRMGENHFEPAEYIPSSKMWGALAFSPSTLEKAKERAVQLTKKLKMQSQLPS